MQSTTMGTVTEATYYNDCFVSVGELANSYPNLIANTQLATEAQTIYSRLYNIYLATRGAAGAVSVRAAQPATGARTTQQPRQRPARSRQRTGAAATRRTRTGAAATPRVRTPAGQLGEQDLRVLNQIVSNPNITTETLRKRPSLRTMRPNIVGTCLARLIKASMIAGTPKMGPFSATPQGITAARKVPTSIGAARARRTPASTPTTEQVAAAG